MEKHFEKAIEYVRRNKTCNSADEIYDLMEEYGEDNDLPEGWWLEFGDEDDVFDKL